MGDRPGSAQFWSLTKCINSWLTLTSRDSWQSSVTQLLGCYKCRQAGAWGTLQCSWFKKHGIDKWTDVQTGDSLNWGEKYTYHVLGVWGDTVPPRWSTRALVRFDHSAPYTLRTNKDIVVDLLQILIIFFHHDCWKKTTFKAPWLDLSIPIDPIKGQYHTQMHC